MDSILYLKLLQVSATVSLGRAAILSMIFTFREAEVLRGTLFTSISNTTKEKSRGLPRRLLEDKTLLAQSQAVLQTPLLGRHGMMRYAIHPGLDSIL